MLLERTQCEDGPRPVAAQGEPGAGRASRSPLVTGICLVLALVTGWSFWPITGHDFVGFDDHAYITENPRVTAGLTADGIAWAFRTGYAANWHPLTWLSHMLDCQIFGLDAGGHHFINLLFHACNSVLLFLVLFKMTGAVWRSSLVAALFAWHPLHVESVAWASERKDVLSTFLWLLTLLAYAYYAERSRTPAESGLDVTNPERGAGARVARRAGGFYAMALCFFVLGLMSKPMLVTLPFVLLLLDVWPLGRLRLSSARALPANLTRLILEKAPFFVLTIAACVVTYVAQHSGGAVSSLKTIPLDARLENALVVYLRYVSKFFWPSGLAVIYPYPKHLPVVLWLGAGLVLVAWSLLFLKWRVARPYLLVGWLWYLGTLVPTIGLVQVGAQAMADRYTYVPGIGLAILVVWGIQELLQSRALSRWVPVTAAAVVLAACLGTTRLQIKNWRNGETLFRHAIEAVPDNSLAYDGLGTALDQAGRKQEAFACYLEATRMDPGYAQAQYNLGALLLQSGRLPEATGHLRTAVALSPGFAAAYRGLGAALLRSGQLEEAAAALNRALALEPEDAGARQNLGLLLLQQSKYPEAALQLAEAVRFKPNDAEAHQNLAVALVNTGNVPAAAEHFAEAVRLVPADPDMRFNLGLALLDAGRPAEAVPQLEEGLRLRPDDAKTHYRLAAGLARSGRPKEAISHYRAALRLNPAFPEAQTELAWILATSADPGLRDGAEALRLAEAACSTGTSPLPDRLLSLAAANADLGKFAAGVSAARAAREAALAAGQKTAAARAEKVLRACETNQPVRE